MRRKELEIFANDFCKIILSNGFGYSGTIKKINDNSVYFQDRFEGLKIIDMDIIKSIGKGVLKK